TNASGGGGQTNYSFTKAGIIGFTKSLAMEAGRNNINVNCVRPGVIDTPMQSSMPEDLFDLEIEKTTFKRLGQPKEVADLVCYLCSE
ncbi:MAG TPA: acetoacetyl-CoA reductase, partial [Syntrophomonas sp.]|nr:acetoacetyl-CoA reductase [Syntrophomonas sp.]